MIFHGNMMAASRALLLTPPTAPAAQQLCHTPVARLARPGTVTIRLALGVPMAGGAVFDMAAPRAFDLWHRGIRTDLRAGLSRCIARGVLNEAMAWETSLGIDQPGDHVLVTVPEPHHDRGARVLVQQIAKACIRLGPTGTDWTTPLGLDAEIVADPGTGTLAADGTFSGQVLWRGTPVAGAAVELDCVEPAAGGSRGFILTTTDRRGRFRVRLPRAGLWGICAAGIGAARGHQDRPLRQDAVLWIRVGEDPRREPRVRDVDNRAVPGLVAST